MVGGVDYSAFSQAGSRLRKRFDEDKKLREKFGALRKRNGPFVKNKDLTTPLMGDPLLHLSHFLRVIMSINISMSPIFPRLLGFSDSVLRRTIPGGSRLSGRRLSVLISMKKVADLGRRSLLEFGKTSPAAAQFQPITNIRRPDRCIPAESHMAYSPGSTRYGKDFVLDTLR